jgi:hypothetical protein
MFTMVILARMGLINRKGPLPVSWSNFGWALPAQPVGWVARRRLGAQIEAEAGPAAKTGPGRDNPRNCLAQG